MAIKLNLFLKQQEAGDGKKAHFNLVAVLQKIMIHTHITR